jgi:hypothetical protein
VARIPLEQGAGFAAGVSAGAATPSLIRQSGDVQVSLGLSFLASFRLSFQVGFGLSLLPRLAHRLEGNIAARICMAPGRIIGPYAARACVYRG